MENLILSAEVIAPLCIMMTLGFGIKRIGLVDEHTVNKMNNVVFRILLPSLLFYNIYQTDLGAVRPKLIAYGVTAILCMFLLSILLSILLIQGNPKRGAVAQASFRSNFVLFGLPVAVALFGQEKAGVTALLIAVIVPMYNMISVILLELFRGEKISFKQLLIKIVSNPLIIGAVSALVLLLLQVPLPKVMLGVVGDVAKMATPLALMLLGASFSFADTKDYIKELTLGVFNKLVLAPLIFIPIAIALGFRNEELAALMIMLASPAAVSSFTMAQQMESDGTLAGQLVVYTSIFSILTIFLWIFTLKQMAFI